MHNRNYCCYRHFKQGKHEPSCTHCYSHVPLGTINPPHTSPRSKLKQPIPPLQITSKPFRIENRTHDYNQIQNKDSLPMRLKQPRVYIEKIVNKLQKTQPLLPIKHTGSMQYQKLVKYFRKIGQILPDKTKTCLLNQIKSFAMDNNIYKTKQQNMFLNRKQFVQFILQKFRNFNGQQAQQFWEISYNQLRFRQRISADAFVYNFGKFYLQLININNTFSEAALRQRMIDLRVLLNDWFNNQICYKYNMRDIRQEILQIQKQLKLSESQQLYCDFHFLMDQCRQAHLKLRFLAQLLYNLTDKKQIDLQKVQQMIQLKIKQRGRKMGTSRKVLHEFFETNQYTNEQQFAVTDILQFCKIQKYEDQVIADVISWIQGLFDYLFFYKSENSQLGLTLNFQTRRLQCVNILQVNADIIREYDQFLQHNFNEQTQICKNLTVILKQTLSKMPDLQGHKKVIVQCNYVTQILLRFIRSVDLSIYWKIMQVILSYRSNGNTSKVAQITKIKPNQQQIKKNMKGLFTLPQLSSRQSQVPQNQMKSSPSQANRVQLAIRNYNSVKQQPLNIKVKPTPKPKSKDQENEQNNIFDQGDKIDAENGKKINNIGGDLNLGFSSEKYCTCSYKLFSLADRLSMECNCIPGGYSSKYWLQTSKQTNATISAVQSLQSRLFELLDF